MLDTLQTRTHVGEPSAFDLEKYLKTTDVSCTGDASFAHTTFDLTRWAHNLSGNPQTGYPEDQNKSFQRVDSETQKKASAVSLSNSLSPGNNVVSKRSPLPRPHTSFSSARRSVGSGQSSMLKIPANKTAACDKTISSATKTCGSTGSISTENGVKPGEQKPPATNNTGYSLDATQKSDKISSSSTGLPRTSPGWRKGQSGLPYLKGYSPPSQRMRTAGQHHQDRLSNSPQKKPLSRNIVETPLPCNSEEKHVGSPSQNIWPSVEPASGKSAAILYIVGRYCLA